MGSKGHRIGGQTEVVKLGAQTLMQNAQGPVLVRGRRYDDL
jgi:hypothetical protein